MIEDVLIRIRRLRFVPALTVCLLCAAVIGVLDFVSGPEISFSIFYLLPVTIAVLIYDRRLGFLIAFICTGIWYFADGGSARHYSSAVIPIWNSLVRLGFFALNCYLIGRLTAMIKAVSELSLHDPLTKAANWRFFEEYSNKAVKSALRDKRPITLAYIDIDDFKALNDELGHTVGDEALVLMAQTMREGIRPEDMLARAGGDEFILFLPGPDYATAEEVLKRLHAVTSDALAERGWKTTICIGAITFRTVVSDIRALLKQADDLLYEAKKSGKNALRHESR